METGVERVITAGVVSESEADESASMVQLVLWLMKEVWPTTPSGGRSSRHEIKTPRLTKNSSDLL